MIDPVLLRVVAVALVVGAAVAAGWWWRRRDGIVREVSRGVLRPEDLREVGLALDGAEAGAVLFGSPTCSPCDTVRRLLGELTAERAGFRWAYADAAEHLDLVRAQRVLRVPTLLVVGPDGRVLARTSGVPRVEELRAVVERGAAFEGSGAG